MKYIYELNNYISTPTTAFETVPGDVNRASGSPAIRVSALTVARPKGCARCKNNSTGAQVDCRITLPTGPEPIEEYLATKYVAIDA